MSPVGSMLESFPVEERLANLDSIQVFRSSYDRVRLFIEHLETEARLREASLRGWIDLPSRARRKLTPISLPGRPLSKLLHEDWESFATIDLSPGLLDVVRAQAFRHALRALDLLHLSAAMWLRRIATTPVVLVSSDQDQLAAARRESLPVFDPEHDDPATLV